MINATCTTDQKVKITANPRKPTGGPTALDGDLDVTVASGAGTSEPVDGDPKSFYVSSDEPGETTFVVKGKADLGAGATVDIEDVVVLTVVGRNAHAFGLYAGAHEPKS